MTLNEFKEKYLKLGKVEFHSYGAGALYQCVDLVNQYINEVLDNNTKDYTEIIGTNAKDFITRYDPQDFIYIKDAPGIVPKRGDIVVWNGRVGGAGHVAIVLEADVKSKYFTSLDQNWSQPQRVTTERHSYANVSGWLRPLNYQEEEDKDCKLDPTRNFDKNFREAEQLLQRGLIEKDDALDTAFARILEEDTRKDVLIKELESEIDKLSANIKNHKDIIADLIEENKELLSQLEMKDQADNATNPGNEGKTDSTNLENVTITFSTVVYTFLEYVKQKIANK